MNWSEELKNAAKNAYEEDLFDKTEALIKKQGSKWCVFSKDGQKNLGCYNTRKEAIHRLVQVEIHKNKK